MPKRGDTTLPASHTGRWTIRRKAALLDAIRKGGITLEEVDAATTANVGKFFGW